MKKFTLVKTLVIGCVGFVLLCSYKEGPAANSGWDCTGAETGLSNPTGCSTGSGCHSTAATPGITVKIQLDSLGIPVTEYQGGGSYTIVITGTNTTSTSGLKAFGFQLGVIKGSAAATTPTNAGTFGTTLPANTHYTAPVASEFVVGIVEHGTQLPPTTGTGGTGTTYVEKIPWTAPVAGTGTISIFAAINAVNDNGNADAGDLWNTNHEVITEHTSTVGIADIYDNDGIKVFPNPFSMHTTFSLANEVNNATLTIYDYCGRQVRQITFSGKEVGFDKGELANGIYFYNIISGDQNLKTGKLIIQ